MLARRLLYSSRHRSPSSLFLLAASKRRLPVALLMATLLCGLGAFNPRAISAQPSDILVEDVDQETDPAEEPTEPEAKLPDFAPEPQDAERVDPRARLWVDKTKKQVILDSRVSLRRGMLEMFACPTRTKEHESVVAVESKAFLVHAALLSVGAETGRPVQHSPKYKPPTGSVIKIEVEWADTDGKLQRRPAQDWVRHVESKEAMTEQWVFAGSGFYKDPDTGREYYMAEGGDFICVSNFASATLDIAAASTQSNDGLLFEAFTERVPVLGTPVRLYLTPEKEIAKD